MEFGGGAPAGLSGLGHLGLVAKRQYAGRESEELGYCGTGAPDSSRASCS